MEDKPAPRRSRLRPLLICLIVLAVIIVGWLGYEYSIVLKRRNWLFNYRHEFEVIDTNKNGSVDRKPMDLSKGPSLIRRVLGDQTIPLIPVRKDAPDEQIKEISDLFPEAGLESPK